MFGAKANAAFAAVFLLSLSASVVAQSEESAAIIQTTLMDFRVTGSAASNFSTSSQQAFSDNLRSLLSSFNFMSLSVSDFKTGSGYVDVTVRAVDATDAQNCTSKWQTIAMRNTVSGTFMPTFNAILQNSGFQGNASLLSVAGATQPAGVNVTFVVNLTLSQGSGLLPFSNDNQQKLLTPINAFLGDHGNASINSTVEGTNQVAVNLGVTLDANTMPQFWFFIYNQTTLQSSLPSLGGSTLNTTVGNYTVIGSAATATPAPVPQASAPISPVSGPVSAQQVTQSPGVPPVTSSASGTVTMNIAMTLYGSSVQPFTSDKQFAAASALAGVFWIIVGTGSVNVISFNTLNNATETPSTAKYTPSQYGRKLLQSSSPAENVVFSVTLPTASQNSLLVLQSASDTVRQQFAGWFVTQMAARGYNVDADVTNVQISTVTPSAPAAPPPTAAVTTTNQPSSGSSTNVGAIVGGVVGGVVGLALIALLAMFIFMRRRKTHRHDPAHPGAPTKNVMMTNSSSDSEDLKGGVYWSPNDKNPRHPVYSKDQTDLRNTIASTLGANNPNLQPNTNLWGSPLYSNLSELDSAHQEGVKRLLHKRQQQTSQALTETSANQAEALLSALSALETGSLYYDKYIVEQGQRRGINSIIAYARIKEDPSQEVVIKFLPDHGYFKHEMLFYENRQALEGQDAAAFIPQLFDAFSGSMIIHTEDDDAIPPSLVLERGSFTLTEYFSGEASLGGRPEEVNRSQILYHLAKCVEFMHVRNLVHGSLTPDSLMWFPNQQKWKLIGFGNWARASEAMNVSYDLRHAAPELVLADLGRMDTMAANAASDMWSLGCIAYELLTGKEIFGSKYTDEEVMSMLIGFVKLPWEENPEFFSDDLQPAARGLVADLLHRSPEARKPIRTVLHSPLFLGDSPVEDRHSPDTLRTPAGLFSTNSEWI